MVRNILRMMTGTQVMNVFPSGLSLEGIPKGYSDCTPVASETSKVLMERSWTSVKDAIRSTGDTSLPCLSGRTGREVYDACISKGQTKSDRGGGGSFGGKTVYTRI